MRAILGLIPLFFLAACSAPMSLGYFWQLAEGQAEIVLNTRPIDDLMADPEVPERLRERLELTRRLRRFALESLHLPDSGSYRDYVDLKRKNVVWSVVAAPEFSLTPLTWCFPVTGCLDYVGFFHRGDAEALAARLRNDGHDLFVGGVPAYSTLGWFDDPVINTWLFWPEAHVAALLFHEMAHEKLFVADDSTFNESYAEAVALLGVAAWFDRRSGGEALLNAYHQRMERETRVKELLNELSGRLASLYASQRPPDAMRREKKELMERTARSYARLKRGWDEAKAPYGAWFREGLNNAKLASVNTYGELVPGFLALFDREEGDWTRFHAAAARIGALETPTARRSALALPEGTK